ncbi:CASP-like protein 1D1 [Rhodamnia argentea]|uniref:CASP-like protein n=1 Tax=Rhodamnia argentea TaxID=178133 RepID=A0A8B8QP47_9MYRT|nr:CASP-like protein 1D1 [Rhodamnia argentea]
MSTEEKVPDPEGAKPAAEEPPPPSKGPNLFTADVVLRGLLFASTVTAIVVLVTSNQTEETSVPGVPFPVPVEAKFNNSPAFVYFLVALSVACLYSIITALASISVVLKPDFSASFLLFFVLWDVVMLGIMASAIGTAGGVGYIALKGNSHVRWAKICHVYDKFCQHIGASVAVSFLAAFVLILLITLSIVSLHKKIPQ